MMNPIQYVEQFTNISYFEILKLKNDLVCCISKYEHDFNRRDPAWEGFQIQILIINGIWKQRG